MQFYKQRDFGEFINDTFKFFKLYGKNYFKNFLLINGVLLLLLLILVVVGYGEFWKQLFSSNINGENFFFDDYFQENQIVLAIVTIAAALLLVAISVMMYTFPVLYLKRLSENNQLIITTDEIIGDIKARIGRLVIFFLGLVFIVLPLLMFVFSVSMMLAVIMIGFLLLLLVTPAALNVVNFLLFDFLHTKKGFFESLSYAIRAQFSYRRASTKSPFWKYWGSTAVIYLIFQILTGLFTFIPIFILGISSATILQSGNLEDSTALLTIMFLVYGFSIIFSFIFINVIMVNGGLQYYDSRTDLHRAVDLSEIDSIGTDAI